MRTTGLRDRVLQRPRLLHNIAALSMMQMANYLLPLVTLPYVTRTLGVEPWGRVAFVQLVLGYFALFTNWGFALSATRKISASRDSPAQLSEIFSATWVAQWSLAAVVCAVLMLLVAAVPMFRTDHVFYLYGIGVILGGVLCPAWLLNGLERLKEVASIQVTARLAAVPLVFMLIREPADAPRMIAIGAASSVVAGVLTLAWISRNLDLALTIPRGSQVWAELREGGTMFASTVWITLYTTLAPVILGVVAGPGQVGYYALADRARNAGQSLMGPVSTALFPRMSHLFATDPSRARWLFNRSGLVIVALSSVASVALWVGADAIIRILGGEGFQPAATVLKWLAPLPFVISLSNLFGVQVMLPNNDARAVNRILGAAAAVSLLTIVPLVHWKGAEGASINALLVECLVTLAMGLHVHRSDYFSLRRERPGT
jgi:PST family polysaccharide transporter